MSNFFIKNNLNEIFKDNENKNLNIKDLYSSNNTYNFMPKKEGSFSLTSDIKNTDNEVKQLINILISESNNENDLSNNFIGMAELENKLINILQNDNTKKKSKLQKDNNLKNFCNKLKEQGVNIRLNKN
jgi:hypothetical protein